jgi:hypothetical protein
MKLDHQHDNGQKIDEQGKTAEKPAGYLRDNQDTCSLTGFAFVAVSLRAAEKKCRYQKKWGDGNTKDENE